ncbi:MAG: hypothetical protein HUU48_06315 [Flavobacteriales bacterium]|nr:hypothetical protein [Flavobacteriales bacterium]
MKKILKISGISIILLLIVLISLPFLFKGKIIEIAKEEANKNLNAKVDWGEFDLSIIKTFPNFMFSIDNVKVEGVDEFEDITLAHIGKLDLVVDLMSVISGDQIKIKRIAILKPDMHVIVLENGKANWDIAKPSEDTTTTEEPDTAATAFSLALKEFKIENANVIYDDREGKMYANIKNFNFNLSGDFTAETTSIETSLTIDTLDYTMEGIPYMKKAKVEILSNLDADLANSKYTFKENNFKLNELELGLNGWFAMPDSTMDMDLTFDAKKTDFKNILSLVPAVYMTDFANVKTSGKLALNGFAKGKYTDTALPAFALDLVVENANFKYPDLPKSVDNIQIDLHIKNPGGNEDLTVIDLKKFHMEMAKNPFDITLLLKTPISDPDIDASFKGKIDLASVKDIIPSEEGEEMNGIITSDVAVKGRMSSLENEKYEEFKAEGQLAINQMLYKSKDLGYDVALNEMLLLFNPKAVELAKFDSKIGSADLKANGKFENFIEYALSDSVVLTGTFNMVSNYMNLNEFMTEDSSATASTGEAAEEEPLEVFEIPKNIDFVLTSNFQKLIYDNITMENVTGKISMRNQKVDMENLSMNLMGGNMRMNGSYETTNPKKPGIDFALDIKDFDVQQTGETFNTVEKMAPIIKSSYGKFSTKLTVIGFLDDKMEPIMESLNGGGEMIANNIVVKDFKPLVKVADAIKKEELKNLNMGNTKVTYQFKEGRVFVDPYDVKFGKSLATISGSNGFDQTIDYNMNFAIPRSEFGSDANAAVAGLLGKASQQGLNLSLGETVNIKAKVTGTVTDPKVAVDLKETAGKAVDEVKEQIKEKIEEKIEEVKDMAKEKAREQAQKLIADAEKQAAQIRAEAQKLSEQTKKEGYANAQKLEDEAKNPIQKAGAKVAADKLRKETDKKAQQIVDEADKKANDVINKAKENADKLQ